MCYFGYNIQAELIFKFCKVNEVVIFHGWLLGILHGLCV